MTSGHVADGQSADTSGNSVACRPLHIPLHWFGTKVKARFILVSSGNLKHMAEFGDQFMQVQPERSQVRPRLGQRDGMFFMHHGSITSSRDANFSNPVFGAGLAIDRAITKPPNVDAGQDSVGLDRLKFAHE